MVRNFWWGSKLERKSTRLVGVIYISQIRLERWALRVLRCSIWPFLRSNIGELWQNQTPLTPMAKMLKEKYFPRQSMLNASLGYKSSYTRKSIHGALWPLGKGGFLRVGNRNISKLWKDNWLPKQHGHCIWTPKHILLEDVILSNMFEHNLSTWNHPMITFAFMSFEAKQIMHGPTIG